MLDEPHVDVSVPMDEPRDPEKTDARQPAPEIFPDVTSSRVNPSEVPPDAETSEIDVEQEIAKQRAAPKRTSAPPPPPHDTGVGDLPSPDVYDQLVSRYLHAQTESERESVAQRLEDDSLSEHTVVRYYAVEAMSKLGRDTFSSALLAASEDDNEAVRTLALEALRR